MANGWFQTEKGKVFYSGLLMKFLGILLRREKASLIMKVKKVGDYFQWDRNFDGNHFKTKVKTVSSDIDKLQLCFKIYSI